MGERDRVGNFDVVIADVALYPNEPHGVALARMIRHKHPNILRILFVTGVMDIERMEMQFGAAGCGPARHTVLFQISDHHLLQGGIITPQSDRGLILSEWRRPDGDEARFGAFPFDEDELCPSDAFEDLTPDEQHFHEATGNEGASFERTYRRAGLVLWPATRRLAVLNQAGLPTTLPYLEDLTACWETSGASIQSPLWREADELSRHMLRSFSQSSTKESGALIEMSEGLERHLAQR